MPEEGIETQELKEKLEEARENARSSARRGSPGSRSPRPCSPFSQPSRRSSPGDHANEAIVLKTDATLTQSAADDAWAYYQSKSIKEDMYRALTPLAPPLVAAEWNRSARTTRG